ncbi:hypothetical protein [uncultured Thiodictyon sp.]|uniref:hypothetical protein n=1 Tax=uncultured Thiodictyon sp. TaxID=1846217 RepID=UPI0025D7946D|nr:hypothetical protein [uncultured Thiodictyon sp.]
MNIEALLAIGAFALLLGIGLYFFWRLLVKISRRDRALRKLDRKITRKDVAGAFVVLAIVVYLLLPTNKADRKAKTLTANQKSPCEQALASYDPERWHYTQSPDGPQSKWRSVDCAAYACPGYNGPKKGAASQRSFGRVYRFLRTDAPNNECSENIHQFTCKFDRPKIDASFLTRDINQILRKVDLPEIHGQLKTSHSFDRSRTYEYSYDDGSSIDVWAEDSWGKDCSYITSITYSRYEYK